MIRFTFAAPVNIYALVSIVDLGGSTSATLDAIQAAIVNYLNSLQIGEEVTQRRALRGGDRGDSGYHEADLLDPCPEPRNDRASGRYR